MAYTGMLLLDQVKFSTESILKFILYKVVIKAIKLSYINFYSKNQLVFFRLLCFLIQSCCMNRFFYFVWVYICIYSVFVMARNALIFTLPGSKLYTNIFLHRLSSQFCLFFNVLGWSFWILFILGIDIFS
jgi:hypothetical protein